MTGSDWLQLLLFSLLLVAFSYPLAGYLDNVFSGQNFFLKKIFGPLERLIYKLLGIHETEETSWNKYAFDLLAFSAASFGLTFLVLRFQHWLPLNPQNMGELSWHLAFNTATSFLTNTNWQSYGGESTLSYFSQMVGLTFQNFVSAAVGMSACLAVLRGISRKETKNIGNFWVDLVRGNLYILLPLSFVFAIFLMSQGVIQNFLPTVEVTTLEGGKQLIAQGPVASQVAIKMLGTNGGGFFNANAAHPYENPTGLSNFVQMLSIFLIPSAFVFLLGRMTNHKKHAWSIWAGMFVLFAAGVLVCSHFEAVGNPLFSNLGLNSVSNMEGKETRFGTFASCLFATVTTDASCGAVNAMHDSLTPMGGLVTFVNMLLGEVVFGGVGAGLYGMILYIILTVFLAGLMVGRTPEYLGKRIESLEVKLSSLAIILTSFTILLFTALGAVLPQGISSLSNPGAHGFSEIFYAYTSATQNNGSAFGGLNANTPFWNSTLAIAMFVGRFFMIIPMLAIAGSLAAKKTRPISDASFPVHGALFVTLLIGIIVIVGALTYIPALSLGPVVEQFQMLRNQSY
jgi:K+-transporting ATPase ATPase A chain